MTPNPFLEWLFGERGQVIVAGAAGGLVRWLTLRAHWTDGLIAISVGGICAAYISPLAIPMISPVLQFVTDSPVQRATFSGFVVGLGGIAITQWILDIIAARRRKINGNDPQRPQPPDV